MIFVGYHESHALIAYQKSGSLTFTIANLQCT